MALIYSAALAKVASMFLFVGELKMAVAVILRLRIEATASDIYVSTHKGAKMKRSKRCNGRKNIIHNFKKILNTEQL